MLKKEKRSDQLMLSLEDFPVSRGHKLEKKKEQKTIETSGMKCLELLKMLNQDGLSEKMSKALLTWNWVSPARSLTWKTKTLPSGHLHMVLSVSKLTTKDKDALLWPTPTTNDTEHPNAKIDEYGRRKATKEGGTTHSLNLADKVRFFPTPSANEDACGTPKG